VVSQGESTSLLTPVHSDLVLVCLKARMYTMVKPFLDSPIYEIAPKVQLITFLASCCLP
jgi:hypothetical protein